MAKKATKGKRRSRLPSESYPPESTVGDQPSRGAKGAAARAPARETSKREELREKIAVKAYELFEQGGRVHGRDLDDWLEAEQLVVSELQADAGQAEDE